MSLEMTARGVPPSDWREDVFPRIEWVKRIGEGGYLPDGYGVAWREPWRCETVCMPIPLNAIVGRIRSWWIALRHGLGIQPDLWALQLMAEFDRGFAVGRADGEARAAVDRHHAVEQAYFAGRQAAHDAVLALLDRQITTIRMEKP